MGALVRLMPNTDRPSEYRRRVFANLAHSSLLYCAPTWSPSAFRDNRNVRVLASAQCPASIRCASAYHAVSPDAVTIITRTPPH